MKSPSKTVEKASIAIRKRFLAPKLEDVSRLLHLIQNVPDHRPDIDSWHQETRDLVRSLITTRVSSDDLSSILTGLIGYKATGVTPEATQLSLVRAYCNTTGFLQELLHRIMFHKTEIEAPEKIPFSSFFGTVSEKTTRKILNELEEFGYSVMPFQLPMETIGAIKSHSQTLNYALKERFNDNVPNAIKTIDPTRPPESVSAYANTDDVLGSDLLKDLMHDPLMVYLASAHMRADVAPIDATLWYSFPSPSKAASSVSAQLYHFDLDTLRWLKVFYYLSDVTLENGPHTYVEGSHIPGAKNSRLLKMGYARITDSEMAAAQPQKSVTITGPAGTIILADTRCFHKGTPLNTGHRLIFSPIYAPSKIGYFFGRTRKA